VEQTSPADKPLRADARRNRARILATAEEVFAAEGTNAATETIARRAGVGIGTLFRHFPTKEALLAAVVIARIEGLATTAEGYGDAPDPAAAFAAFFAQMVEAIVTKNAFTAPLLGESRAAAIADPALVGRLRGAIALLLARAQAVGAVRADVAIDEVMALIIGAAHAVEHSDPARREHLLAIILDGLRPCSPNTSSPER
jgi:AcrR family transcriptional regulator